MKIFKFFPVLLVFFLLTALFAPCALALDGPELTAQAVLLADLDSGAVLYERNADVQRSPASITKIMTIMLTLEAVERGEISLDDPVTAGPDCRRGMRDDSSSVDIAAGETMTLGDLLYCAAVASGNDACNVLAVYVAGDIPSFVVQMNRRAEGLGPVPHHPGGHAPAPVHGALRLLLRYDPRHQHESRKGAQKFQRSDLRRGHLRRPLPL